MFEQTDAAAQHPILCLELADAEMKYDASADPHTFKFSNKLGVKDENGIVHTADECEFLDRTTERNNSSASASRELTLEFLDSRNGEKYDRLVRGVKIVTPFKRTSSFVGSSRSNSPNLLVSTDCEHGVVSGNIVQQSSSVRRSSSSSSSTNENNRNDGPVTIDPPAATGFGRKKRRCSNQELEMRSDVLARRQKQIDYGKNTIGYDNYIQQVPRNKRSKDDPWTPPKQFKYSRRAFDGLIRVWRMKLHCFDPPNTNETNDLSRKMLAMMDGENKL